MARVLLLTGLPGVGKTTVTQRLASLLTPGTFTGFITEEIRRGGRRVGFGMTTWCGTERVLAHVDRKGGPRVGRYGVDVAAVDDVTRIALSLEQSPTLYLIDEVGKMECYSRVFVEAMRSLFSSDRVVVATVGMKGGGFSGEVRGLPGAELWTVTRSNRDEMPRAAATWVEKAVGDDAVGEPFQTGHL
ncbi:nucleoside-triphosphatase [Planctomycetota bacterium]